MTEIPMPEDAMKAPRGERPLGVMILAVLNWLEALIIIAFGAIVFSWGFIWPIVGLIIILIGLFFFYIGLGLWNLRGWAWTWAMLLNILGAIITLIGQMWLGLGVSIIIIVYLNAPDIRRVFR
ncbi:MAG: hypothetical protein ACFFAZ_02560 [Promethearchaeota archaeon]